MWQHTQDWWWKFHDSFHGSDTIVWARAQLMLGCAYTAMQGVDISAFVSDHRLLQCYIFANALATEMLRRRNATDLH